MDGDDERLISLRSLGGKTSEWLYEDEVSLETIEREQRGWLQKIDFLFDGRKIPEKQFCLPIRFLFPRQSHEEVLKLSIVAYPHPEPFNDFMIPHPETNPEWQLPGKFDTYHEFGKWAARWHGSLPYRMRAERFRLLRPLRPRGCVLSRKKDLIPTWRFLMIAMQAEADEIRYAIKANRCPKFRKFDRVVFKRMCLHAFYAHITPELNLRTRIRLKLEIVRVAKKWLVAWSRSEERKMLYSAMENAIRDWYSGMGTTCCFW